MKKSDPLIERLQTVTLFSACSRQELELVARHATTLHAKAGHELAHMGGFGHEFVVLLEGTASVTLNGEEIAQLGPGDFFGEVSLLDGGPRTATVTATTDVVAEVSTAAEFTALLDGSPTLSRKLLVGLARRLRAADLQLAH